MNWFFFAPRDASWVGLILVTTLLLIAIRRFASDQSLLRDATSDEKTLRRLIGHARAVGDDSAQKRHRGVRTRVALARLGAELRPTVLSVILLGIVLAWASTHFEYFPPQDDDAVSLRLEAPVSAVGKAAHVVPQDGVKSTSGWISMLNRPKSNGLPKSQAEWRLKFRGRSEPYRLTIRLEKDTYIHEILVGQTVYRPPTVIHSETVATHALLKPYRPFGVTPGLSALGAAPWLVGYIAVAVPLFLLLKKWWNVV